MELNAAPASSGAAIHLPPAKHDATLIFLHGLGDSGDGWLQMLADALSHFNSLKIVCPHAAAKPVTLNFGMSMPSWHDIRSLEAIDDGDWSKYAGLDESIAFVRAAVAKEVQAGIAPQRIIVGGFSQGACVTLWSSFQLETPIGGAIALSGKKLSFKIYFIFKFLK